MNNEYGSRPGPHPNLAPSQSAEPGRQINLQTLRAGTPESPVVRKNDMAAVLADHAPVGKNGHGIKLLVDNAVGTARFFLGHCRRLTLALASARSEL